MAPILVVPSLFAVGMAVSEWRVGSLQPLAFHPATLMPSAETMFNARFADPHALSLAADAASSEISQQPASEASQRLQPVFNSDFVNQYIRTYDDFINEVKSALEAIKTGDVSKYKRIILRTQELEQTAVKAEELLNPEEQREFSAYLAGRADEIQEFANQHR